MWFYRAAVIIAALVQSVGIYCAGTLHWLMVPIFGMDYLHLLVALHFLHKLISPRNLDWLYCSRIHLVKQYPAVYIFQVEYRLPILRLPIYCI